MKRYMAYGIAIAVMALGAGALAVNTGSERAADKPKTSVSPYVRTSQKIVPILSIGSGLRVGAAVVAGAAEDVKRVSAVAQIEGTFNNSARIRALVPVSSENVVSNIQRVPGTAVIAIADIKL